MAFYRVAEVLEVALCIYGRREYAERLSSCGPNSFYNFLVVFLKLLGNDKAQMVFIGLLRNLGPVEVAVVRAVFDKAEALFALGIYSLGERKF